MRQTNGMRGPAQERTAAVRRVVQAVLQRPAALPLPSAGANLRRGRPVTAGESGAYLTYISLSAIWVEPWSLHASSLLYVRDGAFFLAFLCIYKRSVQS